MLKICSQCGEEKPLSDFALLRLSRDGHRGYCKNHVGRNIVTDIAKLILPSWLRAYLNGGRLTSRITETTKIIPPGNNDVNEADLLQHAVRCRRLAQALSDEVGRRALLDPSAECDNIAARLRRDNVGRPERAPARRPRANNGPLEELDIFGSHTGKVVRVKEGEPLPDAQRAHRPRYQPAVCASASDSGGLGVH